MYTKVAIVTLMFFMNMGQLSERDSRVVTTLENLQTLRLAVSSYVNNTGKLPSADLNEIYTVQSSDSGKKSRQLEAIPPELISVNEARPAKENPANRKVHNVLNSEGGWYYNPQTGKVYVNFNTTLGEDWGKYSGQNPCRW